MTGLRAAVVLGLTSSLPLALAACDRRAEPRADARAAERAADSAHAEALPPLAPSVLHVPVAYDLAPAVAALEAAVPRSFGHLDERRPVPGHPRLSVAFAAERSPFVVRVRGSTATVEAIVTYQGKGWYKPPLAPAVGASCGTGDQAPRLRVALATTARLGADWRLASRTRVPVVEPATDSARDRCRVTLLKYDVTERVLAAARAQLEGKAALVDDRVAALDVRGRVERWWTLLQRPIRIRDSLWLEIRPAAVELGAPRAGGGALVAPLRLTAHPRVVTGPRPDSTALPLPGLGVAESGPAPDSGLHVRLDAALDYETATRVLASKVVGRSFERGGRRVAVRDAAVTAAPGGRIALTLRVAGAADGAVRLVGRPAFDAEAGELRVPDLDYDVASDNVFVRGLDWLKHGELRDTLRARARWPAADLVDQARARLEQALNRDLTRGVRLAAEVPTARVLAVHAGRDAVVLRAEAVGEAELRVSRPLPVRRRPPRAEPAPGDGEPSPTPSRPRAGTPD